MLVAVLLLTSAGPAVGQTTPPTEIDGHMNHGYAVFVGTGWYKFDDRRVFVFRIPAAMQLRELKPDQMGIKLLLPVAIDQMGIKLLLPVAIGLHNFDDLNIAEFDIDDVGTISFVPGVEFQLKPGQRWEVKPFGQFGAGWEQDGGVDLIFGLGTRTNYTIPSGDAAYVFGAEYLIAGDDDDEGPSSNIHRLALGFEYKHPVKWSLFGRQTFMHYRTIVYNYIGGLEVRSFPTTQSYEIDAELRLGFAVSIDPGLKIIGIPFSHLGLGYRVSEHSSAIVFETKFPF
jgi:hypothetical protein